MIRCRMIIGSPVPWLARGGSGGVCQIGGTVFLRIRQGVVIVGNHLDKGAEIISSCVPLLCFEVMAGVIKSTF